MGKLRNLEHVFDLAAENFSRYEGRDFVLPLVLKERVNNINGNAIAYNDYSAIIQTKGLQRGLLNIFLPNQWFYIASYFTDLYNELMLYKKFALEVATRERLRILNNGTLNRQEEQLLLSLDLDDTSKSYLNMFITDYGWWHGAKTIDRGDFYISPILSCAGLVNASQSYVADLCVFLADKQDMVKVIMEAYDASSKVGFGSKSVDDLPLQQIFFGAPGTGKSYSINCNACITDDNSIRTTFHPDCDHSTFVGCYKPALNDASGELTYRFVPQAFAEAYVRAWLKPDEPFFLIIEEINRGNCAQIFGDVFQLLDRDDRGYSAYRIVPDRDLQRYLQQQFADSDIGDASIKSGKKMQLPPNLHIWATMNTSDQSLFPIDSAFKRRWDWRYVPIDCTDRGHYIDCGGGRRYVWASFVRQANERIEAVTQSEDKKLGYWFAARKGHDAISSDRFVSKVVFYLWNDVFKDCAGEAGSIFTGNCDSFHRFFSDGGEVNADLVAEFLDGLGVERLEPADEPQTDA